MANIGTSAVKIIDNDSDVVTVTNNRLDVNATLGVGSSTFTTYAQDTATTSAQTVTELIQGVTAITDCKEIIIQADFDNASYFMVGDDAVSTNDTEGIRLQAGDILTLPVSSTDNVSVRAPDSNQKLNISIIR